MRATNEDFDKVLEPFQLFNQKLVSVRYFDFLKQLQTSRDRTDAQRPPKSVVTFFYKIKPSIGITLKIVVTFRYPFITLIVIYL